MKIKCLLCDEELVLKDGEQLGDAERAHLIEKHSTVGDTTLPEFMGRVAWFLDLLAFDSPDDPAGYRTLLATAADTALVCARKPLVEVPVS